MELASDQKEFKVGDLCQHTAYGLVKVVSIKYEVLRVRKLDITRVDLPDLFYAFRRNLRKLTGLEKELL